MESRSHSKIIKPIMVAGLNAGFFLTLYPLRNAFTLIHRNQYVHFKMYHLIGSILLPPVFNLIMIALITSSLLIFGGFIGTKLTVKWAGGFDKFARIRVGFGLRLILLMMVMLGYLKLFKVVNIQMLHSNLSFLGVLINIGILLILYLLVRIIFLAKMGFFPKLKRYILAILYINGIIILSFCSLVLLYNLFSTHSITDNIGRDRPNILVITIDCLRSDHLGCYGYTRQTSPFMDKFASRGAVFQNAYSNASWTKPSVASLFSSLYPNRHGILDKNDRLPDGILTLSELFKNKGYKTYFYNGGNTLICDQYNFSQGYDRYYENTSSRELTQDLINCLAKNTQSNFFAYIHYMDAHLPYHKNKYNNYFSDYENVFLSYHTINTPDLRSLSQKPEFSDKDREYVMALYDGQIKWVDLNLEYIRISLDRLDKLDNTIFIITSDHGEEFWDHDNFGHGYSFYNEIVKIPLIIWHDKLNPMEIHDSVSLVDLLPTMLDLAHINNHYPIFDGHSFVDLLCPDIPHTQRENAIFSSGTCYGDEKYCLIRDNHKFIYNTGEQGDRVPLSGYQNHSRIELYDMNKDSLERYNLINARPLLADKFQKEIDALINQSGLFIPKETPSGKDIKKLKEKLKSLGYF